jgi:hypothetical protein
MAALVTTVQYVTANGAAITLQLLCDGTNLREGGEVKGKQDSGVSKPALKKYGLVCSKQLSSAHASSRCNRALAEEAETIIVKAVYSFSMKT